MDLLRLITCGSVDDGKSTLIGRLLHDAGAIPDDQIAAVRAPASMAGAAGSVDYARLVDGLLAEREQGITIDVAYRYFRTDRRRFIVADTPGHEQYTRNMVTAASTADLAIVLVDARKGVLTQTRRHARLIALLGVRSVVLAVTKMDLVDWSEPVFRTVDAEFADLVRELGLDAPVALPVSGLTGTLVVDQSGAPDWYSGPSLMQVLERAPITREGGGLGFQMPVQTVVRPDPDTRGYAGLIASGQVHVNDGIRVAGSGATARVTSILGLDVALETASAGDCVTLFLSDEIDVSRGDVIGSDRSPLEVADQFEATLVWMAETPMLPGRTYDLKLATRTVPARVLDIRHEVNVNTGEKLAARTLGLNAIAVCHLSLSQDVAFAPYEADRTLGGFVLIDRESRATLACGMLRFALRRAGNIHRQPTVVTRETRARSKSQKPCVVWMTGLSGSGKSTLANALERRLVERGHHTALIDGDNLRHGLTRDLGFTDADRVENIRRAAELARLMTDAGLIVIVALISPFAADRRMARDRMRPDEFVECHVDVPLSVAEARDPKGLYAKARRGELSNFTGLDSPYEPPVDADISIPAHRMTVEQGVDAILAELSARGRLVAD